MTTFVLADIIEQNEFTTPEMLFVIESYIKHMRFVDITIRNPVPTNEILDRMRVGMIHNAFTVSIDYFLRQKNAD